jgi:methionyl aminopeptidase
MAITVAIGKISATAKKLIDVTKESLNLAIKQIKEGATLGDIGYAVQSHAEKNGFSVVRKLVGHGVGYRVHEPPKIPNFGQPGTGNVLKAGMVLAIEPMVNVGHHDILVKDNGWDIYTKDGGLSAHFEHTVVVTKNGCEILTK